jgi:cytochrome c oxidase subunit II
MEEAVAVLEDWQPNLVIVDYDDRTIHRAAFLSHFIAGDRPMQVMLVSLRASGEVVVYDRRTLTPAQAEDWLDLPWTAFSRTSQGRGTAPPKRLY